ncbi:MAG TPA: aspartate-semialdehyde dehydrogenase [Holophagaceae bacterium]|jgi:aspartate-semialdehyde dehydrogenase|nr:aspartate-semialdehyde dehydrogenase [Holophagaceae bacterium]
MTRSKIPVTILGATGVVGQRLLRRLADHPWFEVAHVAASERSAGKRYGDIPWRIPGARPSDFDDLILEEASPTQAFPPLVFSALDSGPARELEPAFASAGAVVCSNASAFRMETDVPLLIPEINAGALDLVKVQRASRGWTGAILCNPNCTTTILALALAPLHHAFGVEAVLMTSLQAASGAGHPGVPSLDLLGNVVPHIPGEEAKVEEELPKILGTPIATSALCHRVPVIEGHTEAVSVRLKGSPSPEQVREAFAAWRPDLDLPSAPRHPLMIHTAEDRPQPRLDAESGDGMAIHIGRLRPCPILGLKFTVLGSNTERGAAGGALLNAELAFSKGLLT